MNRFLAIVHTATGAQGAVTPRAYPYWEARGYTLVNPSDEQYLTDPPVPGLPDVIFRDELDAEVVDFGKKVIRRARPRVAWVGDSNTSNGSIAGLSGNRADGTAIFDSFSFPGWAHLQLGGRFVFGGISATTGSNTSEILAANIPEIIAQNPDICVVMAGTNNVGDSLSLAVTKADLLDMYDALEDADILPIPVTIPPQGTAPVALLTQANAWIRETARARGWPCIDADELLRQVTTGGIGVAYQNGDNVHLSKLGARMLGDLAARTLNSIAGHPQPPSLLGGFEPLALCPDPCYQIAATYWAAAGTGAAPTLTTDATAIAWKGNKVGVIAGGANNNKFITAALGAAPTAGQRIRFAAKVDVPVVVASGTWSAIIMTTGSQLICGYSNMDAGLAALPVGSMFAFEFDVDPDTTVAPWQMQFNVGGAATTRLNFAQATALNLSALGAV